jgi:hypothetical protein
MRSDAVRESIDGPEPLKRSRSVREDGEEPGAAKPEALAVAREGAAAGNKEVAQDEDKVSVADVEAIAV